MPEEMVCIFSLSQSLRVMITILTRFKDLCKKNMKWTKEIKWIKFEKAMNRWTTEVDKTQERFTPIRIIYDSIALAKTGSY